MSRRLLFVLFAALVLAGCSGSDSVDNTSGPGPDPDPDPDPQFDIDIVRFRVWTFEAGGTEKLRWIGTWEGPLAESPEQTRWPWVGYGRSFRVDWKAFSKDMPVRDIEYRVSQLVDGPWIPLNGDQAGFEFANNVEFDLLAGEPCPEGQDCVGQLRFDSGRYRIEVKARTTGLRELDEELGRLEFEVNYPPSIEMVIDPATGPDDPDASPVVSWVRADGSIHRAALAEGDSVPSGAIVRFRVRGFDRFASTVDTDSFCCDERLDGAGPVSNFQGMTELVWADAEDDRDTLFTLFGPTAADSVLVMDVGPFDYIARIRARDEHGRRGESTTFEFVAGFPPAPPTLNLPDGGVAYLNPGRSAEPGEIGFVKSDPVSLGWDPEVRGWYDDPELDLQLSGFWYEIPLAFRGDPDPRVQDVSTSRPPEASSQSNAYSDHVRSFAYEILHEDDPDNANAEGAGDRDDYFLGVDEIGALDLTGERTWRIFVPDLLFTNPELFDPAGNCANADFCAIGERLLQRLGEFDVRFRSHTTRVGSTFHQESPQARRDLVLDLQRHGRFSDWVSLRCAVRLAFTDAGGTITGLWPPDTP